MSLQERNWKCWTEGVYEGARLRRGDWLSGDRERERERQSFLASRTLGKSIYYPNTPSQL